MLSQATRRALHTVEIGPNNHCEDEIDMALKLKKSIRNVEDLVYTVWLLGVKRGGEALERTNSS